MSTASGNAPAGGREIKPLESPSEQPNFSWYATVRRKHKVAPVSAGAWSDRARQRAFAFRGCQSKAKPEIMLMRQAVI